MSEEQINNDDLKVLENLSKQMSFNWYLSNAFDDPNFDPDNKETWVIWDEISQSSVDEIVKLIETEKEQNVRFLKKAYELGRQSIQKERLELKSDLDERNI